MTSKIKSENKDQFFETLHHGSSYYDNNSFNNDLSKDTKNQHVKVTEKDDSYHFELEKHGYIKEDFTFYISKDSLIVTTEKKQGELNNKSSHSYCYPSAYFKRRFNLPKNIFRDKILVDYKNGILSFDLLKLDK